jgi:hypothetical protein
MSGFTLPVVAVAAALALVSLGGGLGCFMDPDQLLWEVTWNPQMLPEE